MTIATVLLLLLFHVLATRAVGNIPATKVDAILYATLACLVALILLR